MIMLSVVSARPEPLFGRHQHHHKSQNSEESSNESDQFRTPFDGNDRFPFGHHRHAGHHHHEFGRPCHHHHEFGSGHHHDHGHGHGFGFDHPHHHPNGGHESNANYHKFKFSYNFEPNRHDQPFGFLHHILDFRGNVASNFNPPHGPFPFPATNWPNQFAQPPNSFPNIFNPFADWPMMNGGNVNTPSPTQQPSLNRVDFNTFTAPTIPVLDPTSILESSDNNNDRKNNETSSDNTINSNSDTSDGNGDAPLTIGSLNSNEFLNQIPNETNSNNLSDQLGGNGSEGAVVNNNQSPTSIASTTMVPIGSVTSNVDQAVTDATTPNEQTNTDYIGLIDVRFGDDTQNKTTT